MKNINDIIEQLPKRQTFTRQEVDPDTGQVRAVPLSEPTEGKSYLCPACHDRGYFHLTAEGTFWSPTEATQYTWRCRCKAGLLLGGAWLTSTHMVGENHFRKLKLRRNRHLEVVGE